MPREKIHNPKRFVTQKLPAGKGVVKAVAVALVTDLSNLGEKCI